jgi:hypothetical protein
MNDVRIGLKKENSERRNQLDEESTRIKEAKDLLKAKNAQRFTEYKENEEKLRDPQGSRRNKEEPERKPALADNVNKGPGPSRRTEVKKRIEPPEDCKESCGNSRKGWKAKNSRNT